MGTRWVKKKTGKHEQEKAHSLAWMESRDALRDCHSRDTNMDLKKAKSRDTRSIKKKRIVIR